jgi:hypothetical protein
MYCSTSCMLAAITGCMLFLFSGANAQTAAQKAAEPASEHAPAPVRDISGTWQPENPFAGIGANGARDMPADGKHEPPYTSYGQELFKRNRPSNGTTEVGPAEENDPSHYCDPQGFPRENLFELRTTQIIQNPLEIIILYTYGRIFRVVWTDGRGLPKDPDPRWFGYSVGKWKDDYTFVVETSGTDDRTWLDNAGRPHSDELRTEEIFHRVDRDHLEISVMVDDPKVYSKPWVAMNKLPMKLMPATFDIPEMMCSPSELAEYNKRHAVKGGQAPAKK